MTINILNDNPAITETHSTNEKQITNIVGLQVKSNTSNCISELCIDLTCNITSGENAKQSPKKEPEPQIDLSNYTKFYEEKLSKWSYSRLADEFRPSNANNSTGGIDYKDKELVKTMRSAGYDILKQIGRKILTGNFNLTTLSFPIKVMLPYTILEAIAKSLNQFPFYLNLASQQTSCVEKMKFVIVATMAGFYSNSQILKPLNPVLGETFELFYEDGSKIYLEQTSHHPPISHYIMYGPNSNFKFSGFSNFSSSAGLNSLKVNFN
jgi:hypothetical protein